MPTGIETDRLVSTKAGLQEIFSSIQGEGVIVGKRQIFVRFNACHLKCAYCDTPQHPAAEQCRIETESGAGNIALQENPVTAETVLHWIKHFTNQAKVHSVSFTGGEPLLYTAFLKVLLPHVVQILPVYLETSGTQPNKLNEILPWVSMIAMDIKLPSATGEPMLLQEHQQFYQLGKAKDLFAKLVFSQDTTCQELDAVREIVTDKATPIILQPVTDLSTGNVSVSARKIQELEQFLSRQFEDVRVIPQTHKMISLP